MVKQVMKQMMNNQTQPDTIDMSDFEGEEFAAQRRK